MRIDSGNAAGIQSLASAAILSAAPGYPSAPSATPSISATQVQTDPGSQRTNEYEGAFEDIFDSNISEKLKDPEMQQEFDKVLDYANKLLFKDNGVLQFSRHEATNTTLIKLVDSKTKEVLKEFPPEKILNMIADLWEVAGLVVNKKA